MRRLFTFRKTYFLLTLLLFGTEVLIALFVHDRFIRPYVGDFLVVMLVYCFLRTMINRSVIQLAVFALLFSYVVEMLQYLNILGILGLQESKVARVVMGNSFEWTDLVAYTLGIGAVLGVEKTRTRALGKALR